jgi:hypothetical protein
MSDIPEVHYMDGFEKITVKHVLLSQLPSRRDFGEKIVAVKILAYWI